MLTGITTRLATWVLDTPRWKLVTAVLVVMFVKTGLTFVAPATLEMAVDPYSNPYDKPWQQYQFWSWLGPFLAHHVGATTDVTFTLFYLAFSMLFTALMVRWLFRTLDDQVARVALILFALVPVSAAPYYWVFTDSLTLFLMACALYVPRNWIALLVIGTALGMQHFEQGFMAMAAATFALAWAGRRGAKLAYSWKWSAALLVGTIAGKVLLVVIFSRLGIHVNSGRLWYVVNQWASMMRRFAYTWHFVVFSMFAVAWLVVIPLLRSKRPEAHPFGVAILGLFLLLPISDDPTRVFAIVTFPLVCVFLLRNTDFLATIGRDLIGLLVILWLLVPWMFVWRGKPLVTAVPYDLYETVNYLGKPSDQIYPRHPPRDPRFF